MSRVGAWCCRGHRVSCRSSWGHMGELKEAMPPPTGVACRSYESHKVSSGCSGGHIGELKEVAPPREARGATQALEAVGGRRIVVWCWRGRRVSCRSFEGCLGELREATPPPAGVACRSHENHRARSERSELKEVSSRRTPQRECQRRVSVNSR